MQLSLVAVNRGPSISSNLIIDIFIPTNDNDEDSYYIYLFSVTTPEIAGGGSISCSASELNPQNLPPPASNKRERYSTCLQWNVTSFLSEMYLSCPFLCTGSFVWCVVFELSCMCCCFSLDLLGE